MNDDSGLRLNPTTTLENIPVSARVFACLSCFGPNTSFPTSRISMNTKNRSCEIAFIRTSTVPWQII